ILSTAGASIQGFGYLMPIFYLTASLFTGKNAGPNPWRATGLEWQTSSPPPHHNFEEIPTVTHAPYEYSIPSKFALGGESNGALNGHAHAHAVKEGAHRG
ncbi:MAG: cytochrome c oxidase subunit I, partial [Gemmataceae bacterium]